MIGPKLVATSVKHVWAGAAIVVAMLVVAGCELPGAEHIALPATPTPAASPAISAAARAVPTPAPTPLPTAAIEVHRHRESACVTGLPFIRRSPTESARWTVDGAHILFTYSAEVWAATADGARLWRIAQAWGQTEPGPGTFGRMTSFDVTLDGQRVVYATCRYPPDEPRGTRTAEEWIFRFDYELAVVGLDGQAPRRLTHHPAFDHYPAWSPDGTRVAFLSDGHVAEAEFRKGYRPAPSLHTMAADGAYVRRLAPDLRVPAEPPAWSPNGQSIAVLGSRQGEEGAGLYLVPADGTGIVRLADAESGGSWSPDGTRLAFAKPESGGAALYTIVADGADARRVTTVPRWEIEYGDQARLHTVAWSPDGSKLLYPCGSRQFCVVTLDGEQVGEPCQGMARGPVCYSRDGRQRVGTSLVGDHAVWSPDGQRIAVAATQDRARGLILYSAAPDGSDVRPLAFAYNVGRIRSYEVPRLVAAQARDEDPAASRAACAAGFVVPAPEASPGLVRDCETLIAARAALAQGPLANWGSGSPLELWEGVTITGTPPRVTGLALPDRDLHGTIPPALGGLDYLQRLNLFRNYYLSGPIPPELGQLTHLKQLYLARNRLTGCIPVGLKRVPDNDLAKLGLPDCEAGT